MSLQPPEKVGKLQTALHAKAKAAPAYRFYLLYDKLYRWDVLVYAYQRCKANRGAAGVDGQTFQDIEAYGEQRWLEELAKELQGKTYQCSPVKRVWIPKPDGKQRPLGIPTIRDRVVQMAAVVVLEPIFEADLLPEQHAYRSGKSALGAVQRVQPARFCGAFQPGRRGSARVQPACELHGPDIHADHRNVGRPRDHPAGKLILAPDFLRLQSVDQPAWRRRVLRRDGEKPRPRDGSRGPPAISWVSTVGP